MACQELQVGLTQQANPQGSLVTDPRPETSGFCRSYDFSRPNLVTFAGDDMVTFAGDNIELF